MQRAFDVGDLQHHMVDASELKGMLARHALTPFGKLSARYCARA
jgi:hypothetical protein